MFWAVVLLPLVVIVQRILQGEADANPVEFLLLNTGDASVKLLVLLLWISPLQTFLPRLKGLKRLNAHKRFLGVSVFVYACLHGVFYILDHLDPAILLDNFSKPFILTGLGAWVLLIALAATSFNAAIRKLGAKRWKRLHQTVYLATALLFLHLFLKEKKDLVETLVLFVPLALAEGVRLLLWLKAKTRTV